MPTTPASLAKGESAELSLTFQQIFAVPARRSFSPLGFHGNPKSGPFGKGAALQIKRKTPKAHTGDTACFLVYKVQIGSCFLEDPNKNDLETM